MSDQPIKKRVGGRRNPPGGAPVKGNVKFYCYLQPETIAEIDKARGKLTRGEFITLLLARWRSAS